MVSDGSVACPCLLARTVELQEEKTNASDRAVSFNSRVRHIPPQLKIGALVLLLILALCISPIEADIPFLLLVIVLLGGPLLLTVLNIVNIFLRNPIKPNLIDGLIITAGPLLTWILTSNWFEKDYNQQLIIGVYDACPCHTPVASWHAPSIITLAMTGLVGYLVLRIKKTNLPPLLIVLCISATYIGCAVCVLWIVQLSNHFSLTVNYMGNDAIFASLFAFNYIICCIALIKNIIKERIATEITRVYENRFLNWCSLLLSKSLNWPIIALVFVIPLLGMLILVLVLFGQQPDATIKAFTETSEWFFSQKISPPPIVVHEDHYLCTVALNGHYRIVRPIRYGKRHGEFIVVNRQLCIANAFEEYIQESVPIVHNNIRCFYDKYGYPLSKHITTPLRADLTYVMMKPLEWLMVAFLYLADQKPENRIAKQYLPMN